MEKLPQIASKLTDDILNTLKEKGYKIRFCDRGHTIENDTGYVTFSSFLELIDSMQEENEIDELMDQEKTNKVTEIMEFLTSNKNGFKNQVTTNFGKLTYVDTELTSIFDEVTENKIDISLDEILEESLEVILEAISTFE